MPKRADTVFRGFRAPRGMGLKKYSGLLVKAALAEDVGGGDVTTGPIVSRGLRGRCRLRAKEPMTVSGLFLAEKTFTELDGGAVFTPGLSDGEKARKGAVLATVEGRLAPLLTAERVALNFIQRLSGIATLTRKYVDAARGGIQVLDTRKTTPCMRLLEKYAVACGGGVNHRFGLFDRVLIKDNHIAAAGGITPAVEAVRGELGEEVLVEVETRNLREVREAVAAGADVIMLDNMTTKRMRRAVEVIDCRAVVEVSGGVTLERMGELSKTGADFVSVGALTHSAPSADISMEVESTWETKGKAGGRKTRKRR